jgi:hypothetical protein
MSVVMQPTQSFAELLSDAPPHCGFFAQKRKRDEIVEIMPDWQGRPGARST